MNEILQLKGTFQQRPSTGIPGFPNIPRNSAPVTSAHLLKLQKSLESLQSYWRKDDLLVGALIDVYYINVVAKSNRISGFFSKGQHTANKSVVGARFTDGVSDKKHIITHYVFDGIITETIDKLEKTIRLIDEIYEGNITSKDLDSISKKEIDFKEYGLSRSSFSNMVVDSHYIERFDVPDNRANAVGRSIVTVYETDADMSAIMRKIGIDVRPEKIVNKTTMLLYPKEIALLADRAPYLIAMTTEDISKLSYDDISRAEDPSPAPVIAAPRDEPLVGVIDTMFDESAYFADWVEFKKMISNDITIDRADMEHGTAVSSIIVDGPALNPHLDDGCGRFRVKHFGVAAKGQYSSFTIMKAIERIVEENPDIKVWNLSLGSNSEVNLNSISPEAAILDKLQYDNDVIFIVAGTNDRTLSQKRIGAPADSINSIVVNSVNNQGNYASYSRKGLVLSFFNKPDVSSYGGDMLVGDFINVWMPDGENIGMGTSFAAPWVTRKVAYLIEVLGLSREVAKAMIVDAAAGWTNTGNDDKLAPLLGHGAVPIRIEDVIKTDDDEIKFIVNGVSEMYDTYTYNLPVPIHNERYPFIAKATLCYFPNCSINQGVDYTNTELDVYLGRVNKDGIKSINKNLQSVEDGEKHYIYEGEARKLYRKWDNTKHVREAYGDRLVPRKAYDSGMWGISVKTKERLGTKDGDGIKFGLVVTLKEIGGVNRINDFIRQCELRGWLVNKVDVVNRVEIYNKAQETISFE